MSLDDVLERAAASVREVSVDPPGPDDLVDRRRPRPVGRGPAAVMAVAALVVIALVVVVVRGGGGQRVEVSDHPATSTTVRVVPWVDGPPVTGRVPPTSVVPPTTAPACTDADIDITLSESSTLPGGDGARVLAFNNIGPAACSLTGRPSVSAVLDDGSQVTATPGEPETEVHGPVVTTTVIPPGEASLAAVGFPGDCTSGVATRAEVSFGGKAVEVSLPRQAAHAGLNPVGPGGLGEALPTGCGLQVGTFTVALGMDRGLDELRQLQYRLDVPKTVTAGDDLIVRLTTTNPTNRTVTFDPCPRYELQLTQSNGTSPATRATDDHELNCAATTPLSPGGSTAFELHLRVTTDFSTGLAAVSWFDEDTDQTAIAFSIDVMQPCEGPAKPDRPLIGLTLARAQTLAAKQGKTVRVVWQDDRSLPVTMELAGNRIDLSVRSNVVEQACPS